MSADLFAEFSNSSTTSPAPQGAASSTSKGAQNQGIDWFQTSSKAQQPATQSTQAWAPPQPGNDAFASWGASPVVPQPAQSWSSSQAQKNDEFSNWGTSATTPQPVATANHVSQGDDDDDGWGDFEVAQTTGMTAKFPSVDPHASESHASITDGQPPRTRLVRASTMELITNSLIDVDRSPALGFEDHYGSSRRQPKPVPSLKHKESDPNVLFDVAEFELGEEDIKEEDEDDFDDFGDFETTAPAPAPAKPTVQQATIQTPSMDLLSLDEPQQSPQTQTMPVRAKSQKQPPERLQNVLSFVAASSDPAPPSKSPFLQSADPSYPQAPKSPSFQQRNPFPDLAIKTPTSTEFNHKDNPQTETPVTAWPSFTNEDKKSAKQKDGDDGWGAWEDDDGIAASGKAEVDNAKPPESWDWDAVDNVEPTNTTQRGSDTDPPPINVPPPSIILSAFPDLFSSGAAFFKPMSKQSSSIKQQVLADPKAVDFLHGYILLGTTAARVIAGRKHRWHRDKILAKSMSISAAGSKGMKLAGVDKTQSTREDREAADVVVAWRENVGRLRSAVAVANAAGKSNLKIPELSENLQIQTAKMVPTAAKPCIICGLKREERIAKVDYDVEDSFGEWWVDHWGHRACKNFWVEHETKLRQR